MVTFEERTIDHMESNNRPVAIWRSYNHFDFFHEWHWDWTICL